jgi:hypothetical protein
MRTREPAAEAHRPADVVTAATAPRFVTWLIAVVIAGSFLLTFAAAMPRIFRQLPVIAARRAQSWESLRIENHAFYRALLPAITEVREKVPPNGVVIVENFRIVEHQFLANYLAPRRIFSANVPELKQRNFEPTSTWVLRFGKLMEGRREFQLVRWPEPTPISPK